MDRYEKLIMDKLNGDSPLEKLSSLQSLEIDKAILELKVMQLENKIEKLEYKTHINKIQELETIKNIHETTY